MDLAEVNRHVFVNNVSLGLYAAIVRSPEYRDAKVDTTLATLPQVLGPDTQPFDLSFVGPDEGGASRRPPRSRYRTTRTAPRRGAWVAGPGSILARWASSPWC